MRNCVVIGGAACVWTDLEAYTGPRDGVVACNDVGAVYSGKLDAWVSLHSEHLRRHAEAREAAGYEPAPLWSHRHPKPAGRKMDRLAPFAFPGQKSGGSSGLYAAKVSLIDLGFDRVVFCGVPMSVVPHFYGGEAWGHAKDFRLAWADVEQEYLDRMRSMSGWTREFLGAPDGV